MKEEEKNDGQIKINITPVHIYVNVKISDAEGKVLVDFNLSPFDALSVGTSLTDASVISRVEGMMRQKESD